jgi:hypothetical protein
MCSSHHRNPLASLNRRKLFNWASKTEPPVRRCGALQARSQGVECSAQYLLRGLLSVIGSALSGCYMMHCAFCRR